MSPQHHVEPMRVITRASSRLSSDIRRQSATVVAANEKVTFSSALGHKDSKEALNSLDHYKRSSAAAASATITKEDE